MSSSVRVGLCLGIAFVRCARLISVAINGVSRNGKYIARFFGVQTFAFFPKPMKKLRKTARKIWKTAIIAAIWTSVLLAWRIFVWVSFEMIMVATITVAHKTASAMKIVSPLKAVGIIRLVSR